MTGKYKIVAEYARISIADVLELTVTEYLTYLRDAVIYNSLQSKGGREWLDNAWLLEQSDVDRQALRSKKYDK